MKIVHVITSIDPKHGGLQAVAMRLAAAQSAMGMDVHIVGYGSAAVSLQVIELGEAIPGFSKVKLHIVTKSDRIERLFCFKGTRILRHVLQDASFMHIHGVWEPFLVHASKLAGSVPYCICPAGMLDRWSLEQKQWKKRIALRLCYKRMLNNAAFIHVLNVDELEALTPLLIKAPNHVIPNGVFPEEFDPLPKKGDFRAAIAFPADRRYVLFLSRLHFKKGLDILAAGFAGVCRLHPDVDLLVAGPADGAEDDFVQLVRDLGITDRVHVMGPLYGDKKLGAMVDAECFCLPSRQEGFSMAITEALACATPVVITEQCHFPEVARADAGVIVQLDHAAVTAGLAAVLEDRDHARTMGENGRRLTFETYTWPKIADLTIRCYRLSA